MPSPLVRLERLEVALGEDAALPAGEVPEYTVLAAELDRLWHAHGDGKAAYAAFTALYGAEALGWAAWDLFQWRVYAQAHQVAPPDGRQEW